MTNGPPVPERRELTAHAAKVAAIRAMFDAAERDPDVLVDAIRKAMDRSPVSLDDCADMFAKAALRALKAHVLGG